MSRVPVRVPLIAVASACLAATGAQGVLSNIAAVDEAREKRAGDVALSIAAKATLGTGDDPFLDVSAAGNWDDPEIAAAIASGDSVEISAVSGTPATLRLGALSEGSYRAVLTYNGFQYAVFEGAATVENSRGSPPPPRSCALSSFRRCKAGASRHRMMSRKPRRPPSRSKPC